MDFGYRCVVITSRSLRRRRRHSSVHRVDEQRYVVSSSSRQYPLDIILLLADLPFVKFNYTCSGHLQISSQSIQFARSEIVTHIVLNLLQIHRMIASLATTDHGHRLERGS